MKPKCVHPKDHLGETLFKFCNSTYFANCHTLGCCWTCNTALHPCSDIRKRINLQLCFAFREVGSRVHPRYCCHVGNGITIINQVLSTFQALFKYSKQTFWLCCIALHWVWILALILCKPKEVTKLNHTKRQENGRVSRTFMMD